MTEALYVVADVRDALAAMPDSCVDMVMTSPPFLALRSYLPVDHPDKHREIGSEATPAEFLDTLLHLTAEWGRVLAPHGSLVVELGDTYSGSGGAGGDYNPDGLRAGQSKFDGSNHRRGRIVDHDSGRRTPGPGWPLDKSLCGIPHLYHLSLAYGRNLLTGEESPAGQWRIRNVVAWCRPNPPVGALGDKYRPATSYLTVATRARDRYFDLDAVRQAPSANTHARVAKGREPRVDLPSQHHGGNWNALPQTNDANPAGAPPLDWWEIPTAPYRGSHYATYPPALCERPIASMCPTRVCTVCGQPSRRIVDTQRIGVADNSTRTKNAARANPRTGFSNDVPEKGWEYERNTVGWTDCGHNAWRPGRVLDPFAGSGTTLMVATGNGRDSIGIDLDERNLDLATERVGMFLRQASVEETAAWLRGTP